MNDETNSLLSVLSKLSGIFKANADEKAKTEPQNNSSAPQSQPYTQPQNKSAAPTQGKSATLTQGTAAMQTQGKAAMQPQGTATTLTQGTAARDATNEFIKNHTTLAQKIRSNASAKDFAPTNR